MELLSLHYFVEATKDLNFTQTARRLYISQQTLSNHIQRLEKEYHIQLFNRKPKLDLMPAGKALLAFAEKTQVAEHNLRNELSDFEEQKRGILRVGAPSHRASLLLPEILPIFVKEFPLVQLEFSTFLSNKLEVMLRDGEIDLAVGVFPKDAPYLVQTAYLKDIIYITVSNQLLYSYYGLETRNLKANSINCAHIENFSELPFILPSPENRQFDQLQECFDAAQIKPKCFLTTTFPQFFFSLCEQGLAALFLSETHLYSKMSQMNQTINIFPLCLGDKPIYHTVSVAYCKDRHLTLYAKRFIEIIELYFKKVEEQRFSNF